MRILVIEDDRLLNSTLCYNLAAAGYKTVAEILSGDGPFVYYECQEFFVLLHGLMHVALGITEFRSQPKVAVSSYFHFYKFFAVAQFVPKLTLTPILIEVRIPSL